CVRAQDSRDFPCAPDRAALRGRSDGNLHGRCGGAYRAAIDVTHMTIILPPLQGVVLVYLLTFARTGAMIMLLPVIGDAGVPARVRLAFALAVSAALVSVTAKYYPSNPPPPLQLAALIARESTAGVLVGTMARLIMSALETAGSLIAVQTGL